MLIYCVLMLTLPTTIRQEEFKQDETAQVQSWGLVLEFWTGILKHWTQYNQKVSLCFNYFFPRMKLRIRIRKQTCRVELSSEEPTLGELTDHIRNNILSLSGLR